MMKRLFAALLSVMLVAALFCACDGGVVVSQPDATTDDGGLASTGSGSQVDTNPTDPPAQIGKLDDYIKVAKEATVVYGDGNTNTLRLPEIVLNSADASKANKEIMDRFGKDCEDNSEYSPVSMMDYEATLNDKFLSVCVSAKYDGGNSYGLCYCFDVTDGKLMNNETLCSATGRDYDTAITTLTTNLTSAYDKNYEKVPSNDDMRAKTLASDNITAAKMYLDNSGKLMAMVDIYAAVGGGHWVDYYAAE